MVLIGLKRMNKSDCSISFEAKKLLEDEIEIRNGLPQFVPDEVEIQRELQHDPCMLTLEEEDEIEVAKFKRLQAQNPLHR